MAKKSSKQECMSVPMMDKEWRARDDADTLRRAGEIMVDKSRLSAAQREVQKTARALERVTGGTKPRGNSLGLARGKR
jgi:hypothetical protein